MSIETEFKLDKIEFSDPDSGISYEVKVEDGLYKVEYEGFEGYADIALVGVMPTEGDAASLLGWIGGMTFL